MILRIKKYLSILLATSFFLPFFSNTNYIHENNWRYSESVGEVVVKYGSRYKKVITKTSPINGVAKNIESIIIFIFPFFWPMLILFFYLKVKNNQLLIAMRCLELMLFVGTAYIVAMFLFAGKIDFSGSAKFELGIGAYFAFAFLAGYGAILIIEVSKSLVHFYRQYRV